MLEMLMWGSAEFSQYLALGMTKLSEGGKLSQSQDQTWSCFHR